MRYGLKVLTAILAGALLAGGVLTGCQKDTTEAAPTVPVGSGTTAGAETAPSSEPEGAGSSATDLALGGGEGGAVAGPGESGASGGGNAAVPTLPETPVAPVAPGTPAAQRPAPPEGRVWCDACGGHMPREDSVQVDGKTLCLACAEEAKSRSGG